MDSRKKIPIVEWKKWQDTAIPVEIHNEWKAQGLFLTGMAIIPGRIWHNKGKEHLYFISIDVDRSTAIQELCTRNLKTTTLQELSTKIIVEQHKDDLHRAHLSFYSSRRFPCKSADQIVGIEVKSLGSDGIVICSPSVHKNGYRYEVFGTMEPICLNDRQAAEFMEHITQICEKHGLKYENEARYLPREITRMIKEFTIDGNIMIDEGQRNQSLLSIANSILFRYIYESGKSESELRTFFFQINNLLCKPEPLPEYEVTGIWNSALNYVTGRKSIENRTQRPRQNDKQVMELNRYRKNEFDEEGDSTAISEKVPSPLVEEACKYLLKKYTFVTITESRSLLYYRDGVYVRGGGIVIEREVESNYGYLVSNRIISEIKGHIIRSKFVSSNAFDRDPNIINLRNGLYDIETGKIKPHSPEYYSINQKPIIFRPGVKPVLFGGFLSKILYPKDIRTVIEIMAYTFLRINLHEIIVILLGGGLNGKSVFTGLLTKLHGESNVSNVPLSSLVDERFALADLENKDINFDVEIPDFIVKDSSTLKRLTGSQPVRVERKGIQAYDTNLHAKLIFVGNKLPRFYDDSDALVRRRVIIPFPNQIEASSEDPDLLNKLTTPGELSGIFNILMNILRRILINRRIYLTERTIQDMRSKHKIFIDPVGSFWDDIVAEDSTESDSMTKDELYSRFCQHCNDKNVPALPIETFGKKIKAKYGVSSGREGSGGRRRIWKGIKVKG